MENVQALNEDIPMLTVESEPPPQLTEASQIDPEPPSLEEQGESDEEDVFDDVWGDNDMDDDDEVIIGTQSQEYDDEVIIATQSQEYDEEPGEVNYMMDNEQFEDEDEEEEKEQFSILYETEEGDSVIRLSSFLEQQAYLRGHSKARPKHYFLKPNHIKSDSKRVCTVYLIPSICLNITT